MIYKKIPIPWNPASKPSMLYEKILIPWNPASKPSMIYEKILIPWNPASKPSMVYGKNPIPWNPATNPSMIYQIIPIPWNPNNPQKIIPWYKGKLSTPWNYYCPANPPDYSSSRPQVGLNSASSRPQVCPYSSSEYSNSLSRFSTVGSQSAYLLSMALVTPASFWDTLSW